MINNLVSIITPVYNCDEFIAETLSSIIRQTHKNWKLFIIDDCSTDKTREVIKEFLKKDSRIIPICLEKNSGRPSIPRNHGLEASCGEYISFLDADDIWHPQKLEIQIGLMKQFNLKFCCSNIIDFHDSNEIHAMMAQTYELSNLKFQIITKSKLLRKNIIPNSSVVIHESLLTKNRFNEDYRYKAVEDYHMWLRLHEEPILSYKILAPLAYYRRSVKNISKSKLSMLRKIYMLHKENLTGPFRIARIYFYMLAYIYMSILRQTRGQL